jgi:hypothetical protein
MKAKYITIKIKNKEEFYNVLYYFKRRVIWIHLTLENVLNYLFLIKIVS